MYNFHYQLDESSTAHGQNLCLRHTAVKKILSFTREQTSQILWVVLQILGPMTFNPITEIY